MPQKSYYWDGPVFIGFRQIDLITEEDEPLTRVLRPYENSFGGLKVLTVVFKLFQYHIGLCRATEIYENELTVRHGF